MSEIEKLKRGAFLWRGNSMIMNGAHDGAAARIPARFSRCAACL